MSDETLTRVVHYLGALAILAAAGVAAAFGFCVGACPGLSDAVEATFDVTVLGCIFYPQILLALGGGAAWLEFGVEPFKTARRRRLLLIAVVAALPALVGCGALGARWSAHDACQRTSWQ